ncbi:gas vesicle protein K [Halobium palmae]|uniref:Gas vesicle protein K n=1 Tax=Halobium palmae TaxID=1776492 RepID=A0ABD5S463_9EURY
MTTIDVDGDDAADGLMTLVLAVVDILVDALEREALRRMESDRLTDEEIERLGTQLASIEAEVEQMKEERGIEDEVSRLREDLDRLVDDTVRSAGGEAVFEEVTRTR